MISKALGLKKRGFKARLKLDTICYFKGHDRKIEYINKDDFDKRMGFEQGFHEEDIPIIVCGRCKKMLGFA